MLGELNTTPLITASNGVGSHKCQSSPVICRLCALPPPTTGGDTPATCNHKYRLGVSEHCRQLWSQWGSQTKKSSKKKKTQRRVVADSSLIDDRNLCNSISPNGNAWWGRNTLIMAVWDTPLHSKAGIYLIKQHGQWWGTVRNLSTT